MVPVILFEDAWSDTDEGSVSNWFFDDGASVREGDLICEVMLAKTAVEIQAPAGGRLEILAATDTIVTKGTTLANIHR
jgi:pyruvate/2-oxoglutarate dehydrogenase complex dihydrolipoamide acyltransferase (E2) component